MIEQKCKNKVREKLRRQIENLGKLFRAYQVGKEQVENLGFFPEYGLCFDYVPRGTFGDQRRGYFRYQLSWGGPSDEFRFFVDETFTPTRIEYWFIDWFDGAHIILRPGSAEHGLMCDIWAFFKEIGSVKEQFEEVTSPDEP